jgi:hypothetical protein
MSRTPPELAQIRRPLVELARLRAHLLGVNPSRFAAGCFDELPEAHGALGSWHGGAAAFGNGDILQVLGQMASRKAFDRGQELAEL